MIERFGKRWWGMRDSNPIEAFRMHSQKQHKHPVKIRQSATSMALAKSVFTTFLRNFTVRNCQEFFDGRGIDGDGGRCRSGNGTAVAGHERNGVFCQSLFENYEECRARDSGCGQGGEAGASLEQAVTAEPTPATGSRPAARTVDERFTFDL